MYVRQNISAVQGSHKIKTERQSKTRTHQATFKSSTVSKQSIMKLSTATCYYAVVMLLSTAAASKQGNKSMPTPSLRRKLVSCSENKKVAVKMFCISGEEDPGPNGEFQIRFGAEKYYPRTAADCPQNPSGYCDWREGLCHNLKSPDTKLIKPHESLTVGVIEHDDWSQNDSTFAELSAAEWYNPICEPYELKFSRDFNSERKHEVCSSIGASAHGIGGEVRSCTTWSDPSESYIWKAEVIPAEIYADDGGKKKGSCFSEDATVQVMDKGETAMKDLQVGDYVLTGSDAYQTVYAFGHYHPSKEAEFLQFHFSGDKERNDKERKLEMTGEHLVYVKGKKHPVRADSVRVGDSLQGMWSGDSKTVQKIEKVSKTGLYAPLTVDGTLIVDGIKASSYIGIQQDKNDYVKLQVDISVMSVQDFVHYTLSPMRLLCMMGTSLDICQSYNEDGMLTYAAKGLALIQWLDSLDLPLVVQLVLLALAMLVFGVATVLEMFAFRSYGRTALLAAVYFYGYSYSVRKNTKQVQKRA